MKIGNLMAALKAVVLAHGWDIETRVVDGEGEWPFSVHVEEITDESGTRKIMYLDTTAITEPTPTELQPAVAGVTDVPSTN